MGNEKINDLFSERSEKCSDKDFMPLSVTKFGVTKQLDTAVKSKDSDNRKKVLKGDFVINSRSDRRGSSGFSEYDGSVSLINIILCPRVYAHEKIPQCTITIYLGAISLLRSFIETAEVLWRIFGLPDTAR